jgi:phage terminase large subunit GpA-like protein
MKVFTNTSKGETWEITSEVLDWEKLYGRREMYSIGTVPMGGLFLTAAVDVQKNRLEMEVKAWGRGKQSWSINHIVIPGDTTQDEVWKELAEHIETEYKHETGNMMPIRLTAVDSGYNTQKVYDFVRPYHANKVISVKGMPNQIQMVSPPKSLDVKKSGKKAKRSARVWGIGVDLIKNELFGNLNKPKPTEAEIEKGAKYPSGYCHYPEYSEEFFKQLTNEVLAPRKGKGKGGSIIHEWTKIGSNEAIDLHVYNRACANIIGIDRFKDSTWEHYEASLEIETIKTDNSQSEQSQTQPRKKKKKVFIKSSGFISR